MKCPHCQTNRKHRDGMSCTCGYRFALDPKSDRFTDGKMRAVIANASANNTYFFTENQFYTAYCRKRYAGPMGWVIAGFCALGLGLGLLLAAHAELRPFGLLALAIGAVLLAVAMLAKFGGAPDRRTFQRLVQKYEHGHGPLERLLRQAALHEPPPDWPEPDIYDYGVERILVVQHDLLVDLLVRNDFHTAQRTLVISGRGYPDYIVQHAVKALTDNPQLPVYFLHDSTPEGIEWGETIKDSDRLPWHDHPKTNLGLFVEDVRRIRRLTPLKPARVGYAVPVDALPYGLLSAGVAAALEQQATLGALLARRETADSDAVTGFG